MNSTNFLLYVITGFTVAVGCMLYMTREVSKAAKEYFLAKTAAARMEMEAEAARKQYWQEEEDDDDEDDDDADWWKGKK